MGTSGERTVLLTAWLIVAGAVSGVAIINVLSLTHDASHLGVARPVIWEASSALAHFAASWLPLLLVRWTLSRSRPTWLVHVPAAGLYSLLHVILFVALRHLAYAAMGERYDFGPPVPEFIYELRKDVLAYVLMGATYWLVARLRVTPVPAAPAVFDIRDGAKLVRAPVAEILAVTSAGNYAEFLLADGRRPLMRSSLAALEAELSPRGFVRTHRSWLVNTAHVTGLTPEGSGDYAVQLGELTAPLSRRFPEALARLRQG